MLKTIAAVFLLSPAAFAVGPLINGNQINPQTAISIATFSVTGAGGMAVTNSVTASSFTASGSGFKGAGTGLTGTAASLTAGNVTTNANLTGDVTSVGNASTIALGVSHTWTAAQGLTNVALTATGANGNIVSGSSITTTGGLFGNVGAATFNPSGTTLATQLTAVALATTTISGASVQSNSSTTFSGANTFWNIAIATNASNGAGIITIATPHGSASGIEYSQVISTSGVWGSLMFAGLDANAEYELAFDSFTLAGGGDVIVRFGTSGTTTDSTAGHYVSTSFSFYNTTTAAENPQAGVATACFLDQTAQAPKIGYASRFRITFSTGGGGPMIGYFNGSYFNSSSNYALTSGVCAYTPTGQIVNVAILPAGNFSGTFHLKRIL